MLDSHLTHLAELGIFEKKVKVTVAYSADYVESELGEGRVNSKAHQAIAKMYTVAKGKAILANFSSGGPTELIGGDSLSLHRTINDRTVGVTVQRNCLPDGIYGKSISTSCRDLKTLTWK